MSEKQKQAEEQARIVAEQEEAQSMPPYPSQAQIDQARKGFGDVIAATAKEDADQVATDDPDKAEKDAESDKSPATYKTRATKAH